MNPAEYSPWRVWIIDGEVRVARELQPQHLEDVDGLIVWRPHRQGAEIPSISLNAFVAWLDQWRMLNTSKTYTREDFAEAVEILVDVWNQFAVDGKNGKWAGGLSTLEWVDEFLARIGERP